MKQLAELQTLHKTEATNQREKITFLRDCADASFDMRNFAMPKLEPGFADATNILAFMKTLKVGK